MPLFIDSGDKPLDGLTNGQHEVVDHTGAPFNLLNVGTHGSLDHAGLAGVGALLDRKKATRITISAVGGFSTNGSVPQITTGTELLTMTFTPKKIGNTFRLRSHTHVGYNQLETVSTGMWATGRVVGPDAVGTGFEFTATTITRNDGGNWEVDGFRLQDIVTIANAEDGPNDGPFGPITGITASVITIGSASFTVNADDTTVTFSPDTNALACDGNTSSVNFFRGEVNSTGEGVFIDLATITFSLRAGGANPVIAGGNSGRYGAAGICWLEVEEFSA